MRKNTGHDFGEWYDEFASKMFAGKSVVNYIASATSKARFLENFNANLFIAAEAVDLVALQQHKISPAKFIENLAVGVAGFTKIGAPISVIYFVLEATYKGGANQAMRDFSSVWGERSQTWGQIKMESGGL